MEPSSAPALYCLAMGAEGNENASKAYAAMLDYAKQKGAFWDYVRVGEMAIGHFVRSIFLILDPLLPKRL